MRERNDAVSDGIFAKPRVVKLEDCHFYHAMDLPGVGEVGIAWDLRKGVDQYLGGVDLAGKRVLEIGPASGFLTMEMEKRGADVVAVEVPDDPGWDIVPYPAAVRGPAEAPRRERLRKVKNSFWFTHAAYRLKAKLIYEDVGRLPSSLGRFDVALIAAVLLHSSNPLRIIAECAARADCLVITDLYYPDLEGSPVLRAHFTPESKELWRWWDVSTGVLIQFLKVMGFSSITKAVNGNYIHTGTAYEFFTLVASGRGEQSGQ
jgi:hypothetical protein